MKLNDKTGRIQPTLSKYKIFPKDMNCIDISCTLVLNAENQSSFKSMSEKSHNLEAEQCNPKQNDPLLNPLKPIGLEKHNSVWDCVINNSSKKKKDCRTKLRASHQISKKDSQQNSLLK